MSKSKAISLNLKEQTRLALTELCQKYATTKAQIIESLIERDVLDNEPEIAEKVGLQRRPPNRFAGGGFWDRAPRYDIPPPNGEVGQMRLPEIRSTFDNLGWKDQGAQRDNLVVAPSGTHPELPPSQRPRE